MQRPAALLLCGLFLTASASADEAGWTNLFDGKTLAGWKSYTGKPIGSKFKDWTQFAGALQGMICLQDHGDKVWFRDLKIRDLQPE